MIDRRRYNHIRAQHGHYASWAVWAEGDHKPKDRIGDHTILDVDRNPGILRQLKPGIVLVGINISWSKACMTIDAPPDGAVFEAFTEQVQVPTLRPGDIVVMDNLGATGER